MTIKSATRRDTRLCNAWMRFSLLRIGIILFLTLCFCPVAWASSIPSEAQKPPQAAVGTANPFTPAGQGTVMNNAASGDSKEFFTITTEHKNTFYLIIDRQRGQENVYLLHEANEDDLLDFVTKPRQEKWKEEKEAQETAVPQPLASVESPEKAPPEKDTPTPDEKAINFMPIVIGLLVALVVATGSFIYFKVLKPKMEAQSGTMPSELPEDYEDDDEEEDLPDDEDEEP